MWVCLMFAVQVSDKKLRLRVFQYLYDAWRSFVPLGVRIRLCYSWGLVMWRGIRRWFGGAEIARRVRRVVAPVRLLSLMC